MDVSESIVFSLEEVWNMCFLMINLLNLVCRDDGIKLEFVEVLISFFNMIFINYEMIVFENDCVFCFENWIYWMIVMD